jgi:hypothetical protein
MADEPTPAVKTTVTEEKIGQAATQQPPPPAIIADDNARKVLALATMVQFLVVVGYIIYRSQAGTASNAEMIILGAENVFVTTVLNYYFGSSSGSTAKSAAAGDKR